MNNLNVINGLYELHETVQLPNRDIETVSYVKILNYKEENGFLEEVTVVYVVEVHKYVNGEDSITVERVFNQPFFDGLKNIMNTHRAIERKSHLRML